MSDPGRVLLVEDDAPVREALAQTLELAGLDVTEAASFIVAKDHIDPAFEGVVLSDIRMPGKDGMALLNYAQGVDPDLPVVILTGEGDIPMAVDAIGRGAFGFLEKPCPTDQLVETVERALVARRMALSDRRLQTDIQTGDAAARLLFGHSQLAERLRQDCRQIARIAGSVLIEGAPGSGLAKVAEVLHLLSPRAGGAFGKSSAAGLEPDRLRQAVAAADGGSFFLNEVGSLPAESQHALNDLLEQQESLCVLAGTTRDLSADVEAGAFNADLYYRLEGLKVRIPALRERPEDIPVLFRHYVAQACEQSGVAPRPIPPGLLASLMSQDWPGNARALMNAAMRFALGLSPSEDEELGLAEKMAQIEASLLVDALKRHKGNASETARALKLPRKTFYDKLSKYGIRAEDFRA
ncbi:MAG: sigma-54 dependent transcriptional regulator [Paracoccaceae bacterium]|nr:sigma-54 dependent transcriptional regulator [Paracoccaceae bacterium]